MKRVRRVTGPWHPPGTTSLEDLTIVKEQLDRGVLPLPIEALACNALVVVVCVRDAWLGHSVSANVALVVGAVVCSLWLVRRYHRARAEWLRAIEALNHYSMRTR